MQRLLFLGCVLALTVACKPKVQEVQKEDVSTLEIDVASWPKRIAIGYKAKPTISGWKEFAEFETSFDALYTVENIEDLRLVLDDLEIAQKALANSKFPQQFDLPETKARLTLFNTFLRKTKGSLHYSLNVQEAVLDMIVAYNALRNQFNIIANKLDIKTLIEDDL